MNARERRERREMFRAIAAVAVAFVVAVPLAYVVGAAMFAASTGGL